MTRWVCKGILSRSMRGGQIPLHGSLAIEFVLHYIDHHKF